MIQNNNNYKKLLFSEQNNSLKSLENIKNNSNINGTGTINIINKKIENNLNIKDNNNNNSLRKNIILNKISSPNFKNDFKENKVKNNEYYVRKWNNIYNRKENSNENIINKKNIYNKKSSIREKYINDKNFNENITLPELKYNNRLNKNIIKKNIYNNNVEIRNNIKKLSIFKTKTIFKEKLKYFRTQKSSSSDKVNNINNNIKNKIINDTPTNSISSNSTKKFNKNNDKNDLNKFRIGLLSAGSSSYNSVIIPILPFRRPSTNFNFSGEQLWNNTGDTNTNLINNNNIKNDYYDNKIDEKEDSIIFKNNNNLNGVFNINKYIINNNKYKDKFSDSKNNDKILNSNIEKLIPKFHKIKIEKGMMNKKIAKSLGKKIFMNYYNQNQNNKYSFGNNN